jgi:hypothetical protein
VHTFTYEDIQNNDNVFLLLLRIKYMCILLWEGSMRIYFSQQNYTNVIFTCRNQIISTKNPEIIESAFTAYACTVRIPHGAAGGCNNSCGQDCTNQIPWRRRAADADRSSFMRTETLMIYSLTLKSDLTPMVKKNSMHKNPNGIWMHQMKNETSAQGGIARKEKG